MADRAIRKLNDPEQLKWLKDNYDETMKGDENLKMKLMVRLVQHVEKGEESYLEVLRDFLVIDKTLVDILAHDYEYNLKASLIVRMKLHRFLQPTNESYKTVLNIIEVLRTSPYLSNPGNYIDMSAEGIDPALLYPDVSFSTDSNMLSPHEQQQQIIQTPISGVPLIPYDQTMNPYPYSNVLGIQNQNPYLSYNTAPPTMIPPLQQTMVGMNLSQSPATQIIPFPIPGQRHLIYLDHSPGNNRKLVANLREHGIFVYVITSTLEFTRFVTANYASIVAHINQGNTLRIICDRQFASDFTGDATGVDIINALGGMGLTGVKILVYCWRVELVSHLEKVGVTVTKAIKVARDFGTFLSM